MADRCFLNEMPDFFPEIIEEEEEEEGKSIQPQDSLLRLLSLPYATISQRFQKAALDLKQTVLILFFPLHIVYSSELYVFFNSNKS